jgi:hypothetical protein
MDKKSVVIIGGYGTFGRLIADQLTEFGTLTILGRDRAQGKLFADSISAEFALCDTRNLDELRRAVKGKYLAINASGPFYAGDYSIPQVCIEEGCHFIDLADGRDYLAGFSTLDALAKEKNVFACTGASTTPAITYALGKEIENKHPDIRSIFVYLTVGNRNKPGASTLASILSHVGTAVRVWNENRWQTYPGWSMAEFHMFPAPVGKRPVQLVNVPDLELFPALFKTERVIFKAGVQLVIFNWALSFFALVKRIFPFVFLPALTKILLAISELFSPFGNYAGAVTVTLEDHQGIKRSLSFATAQNGRRIPSSPAVLLARKVLRGESFQHGAHPCVGFVSLSEFKAFLEPFGVLYVDESNG